jgi:hypothetical protein
MAIIVFNEAKRLCVFVFGRVWYPRPHFRKMKPTPMGTRAQSSKAEMMNCVGVELTQSHLFTRMTTAS